METNLNNKKKVSRMLTSAALPLHFDDLNVYVIQILFYKVILALTC